jgi:thiol-disulfide isomerase/thioredoxin
MDVQLYVYDLSQGLARMMSQGLLGIHIDAVYHTSLVFGGVEYFFGAGVQTCYPGSTHHGQPMEKIKLGKTEIPLDDILEYLDSLKETYTAESYDLFKHNCNNFSNDFSMFLVGRGIPDHITALPETVLNTPFGSMMKTRLDAEMRHITQAAVPPENNPTIQRERKEQRDAASRGSQNGTSASASAPASVQQNGSDHTPPKKKPKKLEVRSAENSDQTNGQAQAQPQSPQQAPKKQPKKLEVRDGAAAKADGVHGSVYNVTQLTSVDNLLSGAKDKCAVVFFTSSTCGPCKMAYPTYDSLAAEHTKVPFIKIDINEAHALASKYQIRATPTFMAFLHGKKDNEWTGANPAQLKSNVESLLQQAFPPHPHLQVRVPTLQFGRLSPITYSKIPPLDKVLAKMGDRSKDKAVVAMKNFISARTSSASDLPALPDLPAFARWLRHSPSQLSPDVLFTAYDVLRCALVDQRVSGWFTEESAPGDSETLTFLINHVLTLVDEDTCPYSLRLVTIQLACNLFTSDLFIKSAFSSDHHSGLPAMLVQVATTSLLAEPDKPAVRAAASSLAFNIAATVYRTRREENREALQESSQVELAASLLEMMTTELESREEKKDTSGTDMLKTAIFAFAYLIYCAPQGGELHDLCSALDAKATILKLKGLKDLERVAGEVGDQLLGKNW